MTYTRENPFYFKGHLDPQASYPIFVWRNAILDELLQDIEQKEFPILIGPHQSGKTTIAYQLRHRLLQNMASKNLVFYLECGNLASSSGADVLSNIHKTCLKTLKLNYSDMEQQFSNIFSYKSLSSMYELSEFLDSLYLKSNGIHRIVLIIDEIEVLSDDLISDLLYTFRYLYESHHNKPDHQTNFSVFLLCQQDLSTFDIGKGSPYNIATVRRLGDFSYDEYSILFDNDHAGKFISIKFDDAAKEYIFANTSGQPYLSQKICYMALEIAWNNNLEEIHKRTAMMALLNLFKEADRNLLIIEKAVKDDKYIEKLVVDLLRGRRKPFRRTNEHIRYLEEKGVVSENPSNGMCDFRTKLYKRFFMNKLNPEGLIVEVEKPPNEIKSSPKSPKDYLFNIICMGFGLVLFFFAIYMTFTYIEVIKNPTTYDQSGRIYFLLLILYAVAASLFLVGGLKALAEASGKFLKWSFWLTGGAAVFAFIIFVGFLFSSNNETFNLTARVIDSREKSITTGTVTICFDENKQTIPLDLKGEANFKGIPPKFKTMKKPVEIDIDGYRLIEPNMLYNLSKSVIKIRVERQPNDEKHAVNSMIGGIL